MDKNACHTLQSVRMAKWLWCISVSQSIVDKTLDYISNQEMHHKRFSFQDEYRQFLLSYGVEYDEAYVFKD